MKTAAPFMIYFTNHHRSLPKYIEVILCLHCTPASILLSQTWMVVALVVMVTFVLQDFYTIVHQDSLVAHCTLVSLLTSAVVWYLAASYHNNFAYSWCVTWIQLWVMCYLPPLGWILQVFCASIATWFYQFISKVSLILELIFLFLPILYSFQ